MIFGLCVPVYSLKFLPALTSASFLSCHNNSPSKINVAGEANQLFNIASHGRLLREPHQHTQQHYQLTNTIPTMLAAQMATASAVLVSLLKISTPEPHALPHAPGKGCLLPSIPCWHGSCFGSSSFSLCHFGCWVTSISRPPGSTSDIESIPCSTSFVALTPDSGLDVARPLFFTSDVTPSPSFTMDVPPSHGCALAFLRCFHHRSPLSHRCWLPPSSSWMTSFVPWSSRLSPLSLHASWSALLHHLTQFLCLSPFKLQWSRFSGLLLSLWIWTDQRAASTLWLDYEPKEPLLKGEFCHISIRGLSWYSFVLSGFTWTTLIISTSALLSAYIEK